MNEFTEQNILHGAPMPDNFTDGCKSLGEFLINKLKIYGNKVLLIHSITGEEVTSVQLLSRSIKVAQNLAKRGVKIGDRIGIVCENELEFYYVSLGIIFLGASVAPVYSSLIKSEIIHLFNISQPKIIFTSLPNLEKMRTVHENCTFIKELIVFGDNEYYLTFSDFLENEDEKCTDQYICEPLDIESVAAVILTSSGTTGLPKAVEKTQMNIFAFFPVDYLEATPINLSVNPFAHLSGFFPMIRWVAEGQPAVLLPKFEEDAFFHCIEKFKIRSIFLPPIRLHLLANSPKVQQYDLSSLKSILNGSGPVTAELLMRVQERTSVETIRIQYGLTECFCNTLQPYNCPPVPKSVGRLRAGVSAKVVDLESGAILGPLKQGEIMFKSPRLMKGYFNNENATRDAFDSDGFLHTGDFGYYNESGDWFLVERIKELIKYKNIHVYPSELEAILMEHPDISDVSVIGLPDTVAGELPMAFVVRKNDRVTEENIVKYVEDRVSEYKYLRGGVRFIESIPKNNMGKKTKKILKELIR